MSGVPEFPENPVPMKIYRLDVDGAEKFVVSGHLRETYDAAVAFVAAHEESERQMKKLRALALDLGIDLDFEDDEQDDDDE